MSVWRRRLFVVQNFSMFRAYLLHRKNNGDKVHEESVGVRGSATACMCCSRPGEFRECQCNACCINKVRHERPPCLTSLALVSCQSLAGIALWGCCSCHSWGKRRCTNSVDRHARNRGSGLASLWSVANLFQSSRGFTEAQMKIFPKYHLKGDKHCF